VAVLHRDKRMGWFDVTRFEPDILHAQPVGNFRVCRPHHTIAPFFFVC
jgi:hypothetical protein